MTSANVWRDRLERYRTPTADALRLPAGCTQPRGLMHDKAALVGMINRIHDLGLNLILDKPKEYAKYKLPAMFWSDRRQF
jgi:hypothetical protein